MRKDFRNYNFEFTKNEKKILLNFTKQALKQFEGSNSPTDIKAFSSIVEKLNSSDETIKFTKDELTRLKYNLTHNMRFIREQSSKGFFIKKWIYKSLLAQYTNIFETHFKD